MGSKVQFLDAETVMAKIEDGAAVCVNGFIMTNAAEELFVAIEDRFLKTGHPNHLHLLFTGSVGRGEEGGINHFAHEGMISEAFGAHYGVMRKMSPLILQNKIKAYNLPQGVTTQLYRAMGAHQPGILTQVGMGTFTDPAIEGGKLNAVSDKDYGTRMTIDGKEYIFYRVPTEKIDYLFIRGSESDEDGNISMSREALKMESLDLAIATKNSGGKVVVQVERIVRRGTIDPKSVYIPRNLVDYVCVCKDPEHHHMHTQVTAYNRSFHSSEELPPVRTFAVPMNARKIAARQAATLLTENDYILNFGVGVPDLVGMILGEEGLNEQFLMTAESGIIGGVTQGGGDFGVAKYPECIMDVTHQFDMYHGGMVDAAFLGMAQCDKAGNINVSKFGSTTVTGSGGFIDISQNAKKVVFVGTFMARTGKYDFSDGRMTIISEGTGTKFIDQVEQITYSGEFARSSGRQKTWLVTERCTFKLVKDGWMITEIAPGVDLEKDILEHMSFRPLISDQLKLMDSRIFREEKMGLTLA